MGNRTQQKLSEPLTSEFLKNVYEDNGLVRLSYLLKVLHLSKVEMAPAIGLSLDALSRKKRLTTNQTQQRLNQLVQILNRVLPWTGSVAAAWAWYRSQPLPGFGDLTAEQLVKDGQCKAILEYLEEIDNGGHA
ncbi:MULTISPECIES: XRE family transcriptional regulator [Thalassospira]|uniref:XRE family transcriptional regulator n=2 Tax=Thalassospira TaxID=168934 RepID=A0A367VZX0_9PROT|nr:MULTISPECIES: XRE family transcriptional regulator [Thalassospira]MDG4717816.1 XRE family transcriptional regulator [Thalassospira sp. FZY0004]RCK30334.1 XRE family transcriptional regulator [Thalassospira profundimaris]